MDRGWQYSRLSNQLILDAPRLGRTFTTWLGFFGIPTPPRFEALIEQINPSPYLGSFVHALQSLAGDTLYVFIYTGFMIASRSGLLRKLEALWVNPVERRQAVTIFHRIRDGLERYLWIQTVTGFIIALMSWVIMAILGMQNAVFWAFLIFLVSFIPVIGGMVIAVLPTLFAVSQFATVWPPILLFSGLQIILFVVGNILLPRMQRDSLNIDPVIVLLSLAFWGYIWGIAGMVLSTPLTVTAIIILSQFPKTHWIAVVLSNDGHPQTE